MCEEPHEKLLKKM